jgi:hypothetical protein
MPYESIKQDIGPSRPHATGKLPHIPDMDFIPGDLYDAPIITVALNGSSSFSIFPSAILCPDGRWKTRLYQVHLVNLYHNNIIGSSHSRSEDEESDSVASTIGVMQALISVFLDDNDKIRCINAGKTRITFLLRSPLYFACASSWGEPESVVSLSSPLYPAWSSSQDI